ncbi:MAG: prepilin-type N-terminal cleavage/methylation domain-containing protein [Proteobacteria bacterium]|nr:prepilin-type N-terminal cleavage/methylation domain-containing protein [Pseudomonadota bacterium]MBU1711062.1 prepilin-type N-terminal cleavage/methylation domain-containing protein [Pseudomonadota bacterium]
MIQRKKKKPNGFTLMELIMVIVLLGVMGMMGSEFISEIFRGFKATDARLDIYEEGKTALVRMERELHNAIPNAINPASATDLQFGSIDEQAMRCTDTVAPLCDPGEYVFGQYSDNNPVGKAFIRDLSMALDSTTNPIISIYNRSWGDFNDIPAGSQRLYSVTGNSGPRKMDLIPNVKAASPNKRFYAVDQAVRYFLSGTTLLRETAPVTVGSSIIFANGGYPLAREVSNLIFGYQPGSLSRNAIVTIDFTISRNGEDVDFHKEVQIRNVP